MIDLFSTIGNAFNFDKYNNTQVDTQMKSYDYGSVMHLQWIVVFQLS